MTNRIKHRSVKQSVSWWSVQTVLAGLESRAQHYLLNSLAPATSKTYASGKKAFIAFCTVMGLSPLPASDGVWLGVEVGGLTESNLATPASDIRTFLILCRLVVHWDNCGALLSRSHPNIGC